MSGFVRDRFITRWTDMMNWQSPEVRYNGVILLSLHEHRVLGWCSLFNYLIKMAWRKPCKTFITSKRQYAYGHPSLYSFNVKVYISNNMCESSFYILLYLMNCCTWLCAIYINSYKIKEIWVILIAITPVAVVTKITLEVLNV